MTLEQFQTRLAERPAFTREVRSRWGQLIGKLDPQKGLLEVRHGRERDVIDLIGLLVEPDLSSAEASREPGG